MKTQLQAMRKRAGFKSAKAFAEHVGMSVSTYTKYEQGMSEMSLERAWEFADALDCTLDELAGRNPPGESNGCDPTLRRIAENFESMNSTGRERLAEQAEMMAGSELFAKSEDNQVRETA